ncbi:hypothetical protein ACH4EC_37525 [Streptomyces anulatus]
MVGELMAGLDRDYGARHGGPLPNADDDQATAVGLTVYRTARHAGADPDALLESVSLADIDPTDTTVVSAAIQAALTTNPKLASAPGGPARGAWLLFEDEAGFSTPAGAGSNQPSGST